MQFTQFEDPIAGWRVCQGLLCRISLSLCCRGRGYWPTFYSIWAPMCRFFLEVHKFGMDLLAWSNSGWDSAIEAKLQSDTHAYCRQLCHSVKNVRKPYIWAHVRVCTSLRKAITIPSLHYHYLWWYLFGGMTMSIYFAASIWQKLGRRCSCHAVWATCCWALLIFRSCFSSTSSPTLFWRPRTRYKILNWDVETWPRDITTSTRVCVNFGKYTMPAALKPLETAASSFWT